MIMEKKKYILLMSETFELPCGTILHRIKAVRDFGNVRKGELGGFVEKKGNLSHKDTCWVYDNAMIYGDAVVTEYAQIKNNASVYGNARVYGSAMITGSSRIFGTARVCGHARVYDNVRVCGSSRVEDDAILSGRAYVSGTARICDHAFIEDNAAIGGNSTVCGKSSLSENARIYDNAVVRDVDVCGNARLRSDANVCNMSDYVVIGPLGSRNGYTTFYKNKYGDISVACGCFVGNVTKFKETVESMYGEKGSHPNMLYYNQYMNAIDFVTKTIAHKPNIGEEECLI